MSLSWARPAGRGRLAISVAIGAASLLNVAVPGAYLIGVAMLLVAAAIEFLSFVAVLQS